MHNKGSGGMERLVKATGYSFQGLKAAYRNEAAFRQEIFLAILLVPAGFLLGETGVERALLVGCVLLVLIVELLNSAVEAIVDRFGGELHQLSGRAKDIGSAAVFMSLANVVLIWSCVLFPGQ